MSEPTFHTTRLHGWLDRMRAGDPTARDELVRATRQRLEELTHGMLRKFPNVHRWADSDDVFQGAVLRLLCTLDNLRPADTREFMNLAAVHIRRELIDLARHFGGPLGIGANHASAGPEASGPPVEGVARDADPAELERWAAFHEAVERLPAEQREVFGLTFYHGWTQRQTAGLFEVDERTVRRRWREACLALKRVLRENAPDM